MVIARMVSVCFSDLQAASENVRRALMYALMCRAAAVTIATNNEETESMMIRHFGASVHSAAM